MSRIELLSIVSAILYEGTTSTKDAVRLAVALIGDVENHLNHVEAKEENQ